MLPAPYPVRRYGIFTPVAPQRGGALHMTQGR